MLALSGGLHRVHLQGRCCWYLEQTKPLVFCLDRTHGIFLLPSWERSPTLPPETSASSAGAEPTPNCSYLVQAATETFRGGLAGGGTGWGASLCTDKNPFGSTPTPVPPPRHPEAGVVEGRESKIHAVFLEPFTPWLLPPLAPSQSLPFAPSPLPSPSQKCSGSPLWTSHTAVKGPVWGGTWDLVLPTMFLVTGSTGGTAPTWDCSPLSGRNPQKASPGVAWPLLSAEPGSGRDVCVCTQVRGGETRLLVLIPYGSCLQNKNWYFWRRPSPHAQLLFFIFFNSVKLKWDFQSSDMSPNAGWLASVHIRGQVLFRVLGPAFGATHHLRST